MSGEWGAPVMYALDQGSIGVQLGSTATDLVLVVVDDKGVDAILNGKTKLDSNAAAAAGPTGTQATSSCIATTCTNMSGLRAGEAGDDRRIPGLQGPIR